MPFNKIDIQEVYWDWAAAWKHRPWPKTLWEVFGVGTWKLLCMEQVCRVREIFVRDWASKGNLWACDSSTSTGYARVIMEGTCNKAFLILAKSKIQSVQLSLLIVYGPFWLHNHFSRWTLIPEWSRMMFVVAISWFFPWFSVINFLLPIKNKEGSYCFLILNLAMLKIMKKGPIQRKLVLVDK